MVVIVALIDQTVKFLDFFELKPMGKALLIVVKLEHSIGRNKRKNAI